MKERGYLILALVIFVMATISFRRLRDSETLPWFPRWARVTSVYLGYLAGIFVCIRAITGP